MATTQYVCGMTVLVVALVREIKDQECGGSDTKLGKALYLVSLV